MRNDARRNRAPGENPPKSFTPEARPAALPRLRADLGWTRREVRGEEVWFLKDPARRTYFRFSTQVAFILKGLESAPGAGALLEAFRERFEQELTPEDLDGVLQQAAESSLLETSSHPASDPAYAQTGSPVPAGAAVSVAPQGAPEADSPAGGARREPLLSRLLHVTLGVFDPDALLERMERRLRFAFTPAAQVLWGLGVAAALATVAANLRDLVLEGEALIRWETLLVLFPVLLAVTVLHEFGHGLACKHFGGEVREMGFLLIYFQPALFCDISDAWMLDRRARLWSVAGGTWVQAGLWALAVFVWRVSAPETYLHAAALIVVLVAGVGALMNVVPVLKLDGYFFLSDLLEIPNLRARSFAHIRRSVLSSLGAGPGDADPAGEALPPRDRREARIFWLFGLTAAALSGAFLLYLALLAHGFTARRLGVGCVVLLWLALMALAARPVGAVAGPVGRAWSEAVRRPRLSRASLVLLILLAAVAAIFLVHWELRVSAEARFEPLRRAVVRSEVDGIVERVAVAENQEVSEGEVLFELSAREYRAGLEQADAELQKARAELAMLEHGARVEEIRSAESRLEKALTREEYARRDHSKNQDLYDRKIIPLKDLLTAEEELAVRQKEAKEARGQLDLVRAGSRPEEIERVRAEISRLESLSRVARENLERAQVRSPIAGRVVTPHLDLLQRQEVERGAALCEVVDARRLRAEVEVPEEEAAEVRPGQKVKIMARGYPGRAFWGEVVAVAPSAQADPQAERASFLPGAQSRIRVTTEVDNAEGLLKPEMTGNAKIYCGKRPLFELMTRRLVRYVRTEFWF